MTPVALLPAWRPLLAAALIAAAAPAVTAIGPTGPGDNASVEAPPRPA